MGPSALQPWRVPWEDLQRCRSRQDVDQKSLWAHPRPRAWALGNRGKVKGAIRALTVHGFPHRIQIHRRRPSAAATRHGGGRGGASEGPDPEVERLPFSWAITLRVPSSRRAGSAPGSPRQREAALI